MAKLSAHVDIRAPNKIVISIAYSLSVKYNLLMNFGSVNLNIEFEILKSYWKIRMRYGSCSLTFTFHIGLFRFNIMPFGLCNAYVASQVLVNILLQGIVQWLTVMISSYFSRTRMSTCNILERCLKNSDRIT